MCTWDTNFECLKQCYLSWAEKSVLLIPNHSILWLHCKKTLTCWTFAIDNLYNKDYGLICANFLGPKGEIHLLDHVHSRSLVLFVLMVTDIMWVNKNHMQRQVDNLSNVYLQNILFATFWCQFCPNQGFRQMQQA